MSDQQPSAIQVITEQVRALADPSASFQQIENGLGDLWNDAEARGDTRAIEFLQVVWNNTQALAANNTAANNVAAAALQTAVEMAETAVQAQQQYGQLVSDVHNHNHKNPIVGRLMDQHESDLLESLYAGCDYGAIHDEEPGMTAVNSQRYGDMPEEDLEDFLHIVYGDSSELPTEMYAEIADFINTMLPAARQYWYEQRAWAQSSKYPVQRYNSVMTSTHAAYAATLGAADEAETDDGEDAARPARQN